MEKLSDQFMIGSLLFQGARWLSGRALNSGARGRGVRNQPPPYCVSPKVLVIPRNWWLSPNMNEKLLTGKLNINTNKQNFYFSCYFFGGVTPQDDPSIYINCVQQCVQKYQQLGEPAPLIVNTMGWVKGLCIS